MKYRGVSIKTLFLFVFVLLFAAVSVITAHAVPAVGDPFPRVSLRTPDDGSDRDYLGISGKGTFGIGDIASTIVVIEFFSMYCPHCQAEVPTTAALYKRLTKDPRLADSVRMIGIGVGNSDYEVATFKKKYKVPFPLFSDGDYEILSLLDIRFTPTYVVIGIDRGKATVVYTHIGRIDDLEAFYSVLSSIK